MGQLIVIEGTDSSGKETQSKLLAEALEKRGYPVKYFAFPMYETPTGKIVGGAYLGKSEIGSSYFPEGPASVDPYISCLYYAADRKYNFHMIEEYLKKDYWVILDRYTSSNMGYQGGKILNRDERFHMYQWIDKLEYWLLQLPKPDHTIFLHLPYEYCNAFIKKKKRGEEKNITYIKNAEEAYVELSELYNWSRIECVLEGRLKSIEEIHQEILKKLEIKKE